MGIKIVRNSDLFVEHTEIYFLLVVMLIFYFRQSVLVKPARSFHSKRFTGAAGRKLRIVYTFINSMAKLMCKNA